MLPIKLASVLLDTTISIKYLPKLIPQKWEVTMMQLPITSHSTTPAVQFGRLFPSGDQCMCQNQHPELSHDRSYSSYCGEWKFPQLAESETNYAISSSYIQTPPMGSFHLWLNVCQYADHHSSVGKHRELQCKSFIGLVHTLVGLWLLRAFSRLLTPCC